MRERLRKFVPPRLPYLTWGLIPLRNLMAWDCCESVTQELCAIYVGLLFQVLMTYRVMYILTKDGLLRCVDSCYYRVKDGIKESPYGCVCCVKPIFKVLLALCFLLPISIALNPLMILLNYIYIMRLLWILSGFE